MTGLNYKWTLIYEKDLMQIIKYFEEFGKGVITGIPPTLGLNPIYKISQGLIFI